MAYREFRDPIDRRVLFRADEESGLIEVKRSGSRPQVYLVQPALEPGKAIRIQALDNPAAVGIE